MSASFSEPTPIMMPPTMADTTTESSLPLAAEPLASGVRRLKAILLGVLVVCIIAAAIWLFGTDSGRAYLNREQIGRLGESAKSWVTDHPAAAIGLLIASYAVCSILLLPVWWLQMLAGLVFGLWIGLGWVLVSSTCGAVTTAVISRWLGEDWVRAKVLGKGKAGKWFARVLEGAGRNGLLVVMISRLTYPVPYGISNYLFGLMGIRVAQIAIGTAVGGVPVNAGWVAAGAKPEWLGDWRFWAIAVGSNLAVLAVMARRKKR